MAPVLKGWPGSDVSLANACRACTLKAAPMWEASQVVESAMLPDPAIDWKAVPYWFANGVGEWRNMMRGGF